MSDSTNILNQVSATAIQREVTINENFAQASPAMIFGYDAVTSAGLTFGYMGGRINGTSVAKGTKTCTDNSDNYIVAHRTTFAVTIATSTTNWNDTATYGRMFKAIAASGAVIWEDHRAGSLGVLGGGGGAGATTESLIVACSDETTALTTGTAKVTWRMPYAFTLTAVRASLTTAQTSGSIFTVDINEAGTTILSTKLTIDNTEKTSTTAATPPVISDSALADDAEMTVDCDQIGDGTAKGLKICLIGTKA